MDALSSFRFDKEIILICPKTGPASDGVPSIWRICLCSPAHGMTFAFRVKLLMRLAVMSSEQDTLRQGIAT